MTAGRGQFFSMLPKYCSAIHDDFPMPPVIFPLLVVNFHCILATFESRSHLFSFPQPLQLLCCPLGQKMSQQREKKFLEESKKNPRAVFPLRTHVPNFILKFFSSAREVPKFFGSKKNSFLPLNSLISFSFFAKLFCRVRKER